jgi:hypothetical protein
VIAICVFTILYAEQGITKWMYQQTATCQECSDLVEAYLEAGPPKWLRHSTVAPMCVRRVEDARPA